ncbi:hypothetical protein [Halovivax cerinus]|uniref:Uncharacterized protein n=1 Tax=Halovivax cerinus TaxID=1487865 RepID=A0ABD5NQ88_9EURY|nr:hypothetical protein [Halovivax cerinus]
MVSVSPRHQDAALVVCAVVLLAAPLWVAPLGLAEPTYHYDHAEVVVDDGEIRFADSNVATQAWPLSEQLACTGRDHRTCAFETYLAGGPSIPGLTYTTNPNATESMSDSPRDYEYVVGTDGVYEPASEVSDAPETVDGYADLYRMNLSVDRVPARGALRAIAIDSDDVSAPVREAAASGPAESGIDADPPKTPVRTADGSYYRVYRSGTEDPPAIERSLERGLTIGSPLLGVGLMLFVSRQFEVSYTGGGS